MASCVAGEAFLHQARKDPHGQQRKDGREDAGHVQLKLSELDAVIEKRPGRFGSVVHIMIDSHGNRKLLIRMKQRRTRGSCAAASAPTATSAALRFRPARL